MQTSVSAEKNNANGKSQASVPAENKENPQQEPQVSTPAENAGAEARVSTRPQFLETAGAETRFPKPLHDHYRGYLPHIENKEYQMITIRLCDSVPKEVIEKWKSELETEKTCETVGRETRTSLSRKLLILIDKYEDSGMGECYLRNEGVAQIMKDILYFNHGKKYDLISWCIMPNHIHALIAPYQSVSLSEIIHGWKSFSTNAINKYLGHSKGAKLWMQEYFDRYIRDDRHFNNVVNYIHNNPVKAGLVEEPGQWRWSSAIDW